MKTRRYGSKLTPATGAYTDEQMQYIEELAAAYHWTRAEALRVLVSAGKEALKRKAAEARQVACGTTQIDPAVFGYSPDALPESGYAGAEA